MVSIKCKLSFEHVGESLQRTKFSSSNPLATSNMILFVDSHLEFLHTLHNSSISVIFFSFASATLKDVQS